LWATLDGGLHFQTKCGLMYIGLYVQFSPQKISYSTRNNYDDMPALRLVSLFSNYT
jgi:hypothetical protein